MGFLEARNSLRTYKPPYMKICLRVSLTSEDQYHHVGQFSVMEATNVSLMDSLKGYVEASCSHQGSDQTAGMHRLI